MNGFKSVSWRNPLTSATNVIVTIRVTINDDQRAGLHRAKCTTSDLHTSGVVSQRGHNVCAVCLGDCSGSLYHHTPLHQQALHLCSPPSPQLQCKVLGVLKVESPHF